MRIAVFCGSSEGHDPMIRDQAKILGEAFAERRVQLVFGGGRVGLMGVIADAVIDAGGEAIGVIPEPLAEREIAHDRLTELHRVPDMHARKAMMAELADAFIAMPGGVGTLEEFFEAWTWAQLGYHRKPCAIYNVGGYYNELLTFVETMRSSGFLGDRYRDMVLVEDNAERLLERINAYQAPPEKWR